MGDSNLAKISATPSDKIQIESFPGARFRNITAILKKYEHPEKPSKVILSVGINNRNSVKGTTSGPEMANMVSTPSGICQAAG